MNSKIRVGWLIPRAWLYHRWRSGIVYRNHFIFDPRWENRSYLWKTWKWSIPIGSQLENLSSQDELGCAISYRWRFCHGKRFRSVRFLILVRFGTSTCGGELTNLCYCNHCFNTCSSFYWNMLQYSCHRAFCSFASWTKDRFLEITIRKCHKLWLP